jgi:hypothetical protein
MNLSRLGGTRLIPRLLDLPVGLKVLPELRQTEDAMSASKRLRKGGLVVKIRPHDFDPLLDESLPFLALGIACDSPRHELSARVALDGTDKTAALGSGRTDNCNHLAVGHASLLWVERPGTQQL